MKKTILIGAMMAASLFSTSAKAEDVPVFSANGFQCGKQGQTVSCKGSLPGGEGTITGTGHNLVYLTVNTTIQNKPVRFSYFSDTGCLIGYTFSAAGKPVEAIASHRKGGKQTFSIVNENFDPIIEYCAGEGATSAAAPEKKS